MIAGATRGAGGAALGAHLANAEHNDEIRMGESRGLTATTIEGQIAELTRMASHAKTATPIYHVHADPPADRPWSQDERARYWELFEREFGLEGRPFAAEIHTNDDREHEHRAYLRIRPDGTAIRLDHDFARREKISRIMEFERGEPFIKGAHNRAVIAALRQERPEIAQAMEAASLHEGPRPRARTTPKERMQEERTAITKADVARLTAQAWQSSDNGHAFAHALREQGLTLARGNKVPVILDASGNTHALGRMLAMAARSQDEASPKAKDIQARLQGLELPSLDEARAQVAPPIPVQVAPVITPDPVPPDGGQPAPAVEVPASQDAQSPSVPDVATPSNDGGAQMPAAAKAPAAPKAAGGGGGGSSPSHSEQSSPLPSLDVGRGPGEPPGPGAHPDEIARHAAAVADYQERKEKAWLAFIRAFEAQNKPKKSGATAGGGDNGIDEKALRERASEIIREIQDATERAITLKAFYSAWDTFRNDQAATPGLGNPGEGTPRPDEIHGPGRGNRERPHGEDGPAQRGGIPERDNGTPGGRGDGHQDAERGERTSRPHRTAFEIAVERAQRDMSASIADMSDLRAAMMGPDPLAGLEGKERKEKLDEVNRALHAEFRASQRQDFSEQLARERMRAHPLARVLREGGKHLPPNERTQAWADIKAAHAALVLRLKEAQKANQKAAFRQFVECMSHVDSRANAVWTEMQAVAERNRKIASELSRADEKIASLKASEPQGERDPERAAKAAIKALCTAPGFLDTRLHYAACLKVVSRRAARASSGLR